MSRATNFLQECPTCGRTAQIRIDYLGKRVACRHCSAEFVATDGGMRPPAAAYGEQLLERAEELLASTDDVWRWRPR